MRKLVLLGMAAMLLVSTASAAETVSFTAVPSQAAAGMASYTANLAGGYVLGDIDWDGFATALMQYTYGSELRCNLSGPLGSATLQLGSGTSYHPGAAFTGTHSGFNGLGNPAGIWTFDFYESYDDGADGQPDAIWDYIDFTFGTYVPGPTCIWGADFETGIPADWTLNDYTGNGGWGLNTDFNRDNGTGGAGVCAAIDSDYYGSVALDADMIGPEFVVPAGAELIFKHYFRYYSSGGPEKGDVDITIDGGATWITLVQYADATFGPEEVTIDLGAYAGETAQIRWHYYDANYDWYWQVDDVCVTPEPASLLLLALAGLALRRR